ncbi:pyruvate, water dikinase [Actinobacteria bacterium YIM 96077]|uniref:Phosphoenolpyruvate synthase n=1 Tax=Phytoactinopolyspora halophila TaxID=1981511 RepID=A0A329QC86_9ACTN|nr:PEP/pyruvate-binding domain-containing protein [Phytoactinopolyspora halophila]AYY13709.1 pyruvate, water dikinase [Actinobacteria bacterium YIM 96077]RAW09359.1 pyruvate, water dikinase [Phytoactinopolyspora halophila]
MSDALLVLDLDDPRTCDVRRAGGKGASLANMIRNGIRVPPGFVVTAPAFVQAVDGTALLSALQAGDLDMARELVASAQPPRDLVKQAYDRLPAGPVAVRSSACAEDGDAASYAGQQETFLFVRDLDDVLRAIVGCWLSFFSERAVFYRQHKGSLDDVAMAVVVQRMVDATKSGVLFTVDPVTRRRDRVVVEAARGIGEQVVSGQVTPDHYTIDHRGTVKRRRIAGERVMSDDELAELTLLGLKLAELNGCPQDIEWAYDDTGLYMLQSRPVTTV